MNLFIAIFDDEIPENLVEKASVMAQDVFRLTERILLIRGYFDGPSTVSRMLGLHEEEEDRRIGIVFRLNGAYSGYYYRRTWDWLTTEVEKQASG